MYLGQFKIFYFFIQLSVGIMVEYYFVQFKVIKYDIIVIGSIQLYDFSIDRDIYNFMVIYFY